MRFKCLEKSCGKEFVYPTRQFSKHRPGAFSNLTETVEIEEQVCPYCLGLDFDELPKDEGKNDSVTEVVSVPHAQVQTKVKEGYKVYGIYATSTVLIKRKESS